MVANAACGVGMDRDAPKSRVHECVIFNGNPFLIPQMDYVRSLATLKESCADVQAKPSRAIAVHVRERLEAVGHGHWTRPLDGMDFRWTCELNDVDLHMLCTERFEEDWGRLIKSMDLNETAYPLVLRAHSSAAKTHRLQVLDEEHKAYVRELYPEDWALYRAFCM